MDKVCALQCNPRLEKYDADWTGNTDKNTGLVRRCYVFMPWAMESFYIDIPSSAGHGIVKKENSKFNVSMSSYL